LFQNGVIRTTVTVKKEHMKGKKKSRTVYIHPLISELMSSFIIDKHAIDKFIFLSRNGANSAVCTKQASRCIKVYAEDNGFTGDVGTHSMRKSFARYLYRVGMKDILAVCRALGHANVQTTMKYLEVDTEEMNEWIRSL
jgi:site-specific recombinase XerD